MNSTIFDILFLNGVDVYALWSTCKSLQTTVESEKINYNRRLGKLINTLIDYDVNTDKFLKLFDEITYIIKNRRYYHQPYHSVIFSHIARGNYANINTHLYNSICWKLVWIDKKAPPVELEFDRCNFQQLGDNHLPHRNIMHNVIAFSIMCTYYICPQEHRTGLIGADLIQLIKWVRQKTGNLVINWIQSGQWIKPEYRHWQIGLPKGLIARIRCLFGKGLTDLATYPLFRIIDKKN